MDWQRIGTWTMAAAMTVGLAAQVDAGSGPRKAQRATRMASGLEAVAALSSVGSTSGWGRVKVEESTSSTMTRREVGVELFSVQPLAELTIEIDGVILGSVRSDGSGWAALKLESPDDEHPPVPAGLPAIADLGSAEVFDVSGALVLAGSFSHTDGSPAGESVYEEKISLTDPSGTSQGVAKVEREESGKQEFDTRATGLMAGAQYRIFVDGIPAGMVTADMVGQAHLSLKTPDDENPLPPELQPIEDLRLVQWLDASDTAVLTGSFTGVPNDDGEDDGENEHGGENEREHGHKSLEGSIIAVGAGGFDLATASGTIPVVVTTATMFRHFSNLGDLRSGDAVEVKGSFSGASFIADRIELME